MRALIATLALLATTAVLAGNNWVPYTDGRAGGCAVDNHGGLYGCTPQLAPAPEVIRAPAPPPETVYVPMRDPAQENVLRRQQQENDALREELRNRQAAAQRKAASDAALNYAAYQASPEGRADAANAARQQCLRDAACACAARGGHYSTTLTQTKGASGEPAFTNVSRCDK